MTTTDIIALVGAAAWLPQIFTWVYRLATRPRVRIIPEKQVQLGFTTHGPIFNLRIGLSVEGKDAIVDGMFVKLRHESGATHHLEWYGLIDQFSQIIGPAGIRQSVERESSPIALKLSTNAFQEKLVRFQETRFHEGKRQLDSEFYNHVAYLRARSETFREDALSSKEFQSLADYYRQSLWWKAGAYTIAFGISSPDHADIEGGIYTFSLSQGDVDELAANVANVMSDIGQTLKFDIPGYKYTPVPWAWKTVALQRLSPIVKPVR